MRAALTFGLVIAASPLQATTLYKCTAADRHVTYQSEPCPEGTQAWAREYPADEVRPAPAPARKPPAAKPPPLPADASCGAARREVERIEAEQWLDLSLERLRELDDWVRARCAAEPESAPDA
jgi:hypothetical protein